MKDYKAIAEKQNELLAHYRYLSMELDIPEICTMEKDEDIKNHLTEINRLESFLATMKADDEKEYLNECIEKATPNLSKIKDVDKELAEIRGEQSQKAEEEIDELIERYVIHLKFTKSDKKIKDLLYDCMLRIGNTAQFASQGMPSKERIIEVAYPYLKQANTCTCNAMEFAEAIADKLINGDK